MFCEKPARGVTGKLVNIGGKIFFEYVTPQKETKRLRVRTKDLKVMIFDNSTCLLESDTLDSEGACGEIRRKTMG